MKSSSPKSGWGQPSPPPMFREGSIRLLGGRCSGYKGKVQDKRAQIRRRQHRETESTRRGVGRSPPGQAPRAGGLGEGCRGICPLPS